MKKIILTGGGTAGHVTPNLALVPKLKELNYDILYIGSYNGMEKELVESLGISYKGISSGKLRRYFDLKNFTDPFRVIKGYFETKKFKEAESWAKKALDGAKREGSFSKHIEQLLMMLDGELNK